MTRLLNSTAVMHRRIEPADSLDFFPTPPWGTRAALTHVLPRVWPWPDLYTGTAWDPCCGLGHMALVLGEQFADVHASDIYDYGFGGVADFLHQDVMSSRCRPSAFAPDGAAHGRGRPVGLAAAPEEETAAGVPEEVDWIFINPPFNRAEEFVLKALTIARKGVAVLARTAFAEGQGRYKSLFRHRAPQLEAIFVERLPMHRGRYVVGPRAKTATSYAWFVWLTHPPHGWGETRKMWIPPCRRELSHANDWLNFGGCEELPKTHRAIEIMEAAKKAAAGAPETTLDDVRREMEGFL